MTGDLRERVIAMADNHNTRRDPRDLAFAVAALVMEECARECESHQANRPDDPLANSFDGACRHNAAAIRQRADGLP